MDRELRWILGAVVAIFVVGMVASTCETALKTYERTHAPAKEAPRGE